MRVYSERVYGVPAEQVVGSSIATKYEPEGGKPVLMRETLLALVTINRDAGRFAEALSWADRLVEVDPQGRTLRDEIARLAGGQQ